MTVTNPGYGKLFVLLPLTVALCFSDGAFADTASTREETALAIHGNNRYGQPGTAFTHFDYVNPEAPKGGKLRMAASGTFDSLNPYTNKGTPVAGISLIYDTLMTQSHDEPFSLYPLIAVSAERAVDNTSITFNLNPMARFHDGQPVTAEDVRYTFDLLTRQGHPFYRSYYADVANVDVLNKHAVRFVFKHGNNLELPYILAELPVLPKHHWERQEHDFAAASQKIPLGSGPYKVKAVDGGRSITFARVPDYWGRDLPVNVGRYNFDEVSYDYYRDEHVALQALKAGEYDLRFENVAKNWATAYDVPAVHNGELILDTVLTRNPAPIQGFGFNLRRTIFQSPKVREALGYAMDFQWLNRNLFHDSYMRSESYFNNSGMEATGIPEGEELALLEPWRDQLPAELFTTPFALPETDGSGNIRPQLHKALRLLQDAGWTLQDNQLVNSKGEPFSIELLLSQSSMERVALPFKKNLEQMGIELNIRTVDISQYIQRIRAFDYDMIVVGYGQSASPGNEQAGFWGSEAADTKGSRNYMGIKNPVVDAMIGHVLKAKSREDLTTAIKALDRVLLWGNYLIPQWYYPYDRIAHASKLVRPESEPLYNTDIFTWWAEERPSNQVAMVSGKPAEKDDNIFLYAAFALLALAGLWHWRRKNTGNGDCPQPGE